MCARFRRNTILILARIIDTSFAAPSLLQPRTTNPSPRTIYTSLSRKLTRSSATLFSPSQPSLPCRGNVGSRRVGALGDVNAFFSLSLSHFHTLSLSLSLSLSGVSINNIYREQVGYARGRRRPEVDEQTRGHNLRE